MARAKTSTAMPRSRRFARAARPAGLARKLEQTAITTYGHDLAVAATLFRRDNAPGKIGRQMQTWVRFPEGWRIVAAHVSVIDDPAAKGCEVSPSLAASPSFGKRRRPARCSRRHRDRQRPDRRDRALGRARRRAACSPCPRSPTRMTMRDRCRRPPSAAPASRWRPGCCGLARCRRSIPISARSPLSDARRASGAASVMAHYTRAHGPMSLVDEAREIARAASDVGIRVTLAIFMRDRNPLVYGPSAVGARRHAASRRAASSKRNS